MAGTGTAHLRDGDPNVLVRAEDMVVEFAISSGTVHAVSGVSFDIVEGETLGIVGESGCGKSTTARAIIQMPRPTSGSVTFRGTDLTQLGSEDLRKVRPDLQMIFQDPISSLNLPDGERHHRRGPAGVGVARTVVGRQARRADGGRRHRSAIRRTQAAPVLGWSVPADLDRPARSCSTRR
ncbi:MAG: ATP-binding cassette domain-containing protein [Ilumatobacteraceae bacterium]